MTRILFAATALSLAFAAPAAARDEARTFTHEGITYTYVSKQAEGATVLEGRAEPMGSDFRFVVRGDRVSGYAGGARVSFAVKDAAGARATRVARR